MTTHNLIRVNSTDERAIAAYLPSNYTIVGPVKDAQGYNVATVVSGQDVAGWTAEDYVIPRLGSGLFGASILGTWSEDD